VTRPRFLLGIGLGAEDGDRLRRDIGTGGLSVVLDTVGLIVAVAPATRTLMLANKGLVIGSVFAPGSRQPLETASPAAAAAILGSAGGHLVDAYWGDYVAVLQRDGDIVLVRGPFGHLPCLHATQAGGLIAASDVDALRLAGVALSPARDAITRQLLAGDLRQNATCLSGIEEVRGGDRLTVSGKTRRREHLWSPWTFVATARRIGDQTEAERRLRDQALSCVAQRTERTRNPLVLLSGGLDSSIVAACLAATDRDFACLNLMTADLAGDERIFARAVADRIDRPLVEIDMAAGCPDIERLARVRLPRPVARSFEQHVYALALDQAATLGCDALVDGGGGDNIFCSLQSASPAADCLLDPEGRAHFWRLCRDVGQLAETSHWAVAWHAYRRSRRAAAPSPWPVDLRFLQQEALDLAAAAVRHPWLEDNALPLPGRSAYVANLIAAQGYVEDGPHGAKHNAISPLVSQPLIEHCLKIPSWHWFARGRNRAAARRAFEPLLPPEVAWRESKGSPNSLLARLFETNRAFLRDHLGGGFLAEARIIDRAAVLAAIDDPRPAHGTGFGRILQLADSESWARGMG